jgi:hypothetical protein
VSLLSRLVDERFLTHRQRSTSTAGVVTAVGALLVFAYRFYVLHTVSWDLLVVAVVFGVIKVSLMLWYAFRG